MDFSKLGKGLKDSLSVAAGAAINKAKEVDLTEVKSGVKQAGETATKRVKDLAKKIPDAKATIESKKAAASEAPAETEISESQEAVEKAAEERKVKTVATDAALKVIYLLMSADGKILHGEEEKFDEIGKELDPDFEKSKPEIIRECAAALEKMIDPEDYFDALCDGADKALEAPVNPEKKYISARHLVWNLLSVAYSDESYDETERRLIKHIVRKLDIDKAVFLEMESSILTLMDIEKELTWIKTTNKPYLTIEAMVNELMKRKNVIFKSVVDLISL